MRARRTNAEPEWASRPPPMYLKVARLDPRLDGAGLDPSVVVGDVVHHRPTEQAERLPVRDVGISLPTLRCERALFRPLVVRLGRRAGRRRSRAPLRRAKTTRPEGRVLLEREKRKGFNSVIQANKPKQTARCIPLFSQLSSERWSVQRGTRQRRYLVAERSSQNPGDDSSSGDDFSLR